MRVVGQVGVGGKRGREANTGERGGLMGWSTYSVHMLLCYVTQPGLRTSASSSCDSADV